MSLKVWIPEGKVIEIPVTVEGKRKTIYARPVKWYSAEVFNNGPDAVKVTINGQSMVNAVSLGNKKGRNYVFQSPIIEQIDLENNSGETSSVTITPMW